MFLLMIGGDALNMINVFTSRTIQAILDIYYIRLRGSSPPELDRLP